MIKKLTITLLLVLIVSGCSSENVLTREELEKQSKADAVVSETLFNNDLDTSASYNIRKNGLLVIKFDDNVSEQTYTQIVEQLRSSPAIDGVYAEQKGKEVCPLKR